MAPRKAKREPLAKVGAASGLPVIKVKAGTVLTVLVDVENLSVPYSVVFDERTLMYSRVDRKEDTPLLTPGTHLLSWSFSHVDKGWKHVVSIDTADGDAQVLDSKSEADKDSPYTIGLALVVAS